MKELIYQFEASLLEPAIRYSALELDRLISDDFIEFGSSGKVYNKSDILKDLPLSREINEFVIKDFQVRALSKDVMLATYHITIDSVLSLRSSIWKYRVGNWQIVFHQGTRTIY